MITYDRLFIGGSWAEPSNPELLDIASPHDRSVVGRAAQAHPADIDRTVAAARASFEAGAWRLTPPAERIAVLRRFNALREKNAEKIARLISLENGSAGWFTRAGQPGLTRQANAYLKAAEQFGWEETLVPSDPASPVRSVVRREAIGVVAAVIPWNSPFSSATSKIIPALVAGNSVVLKVSPENSLSMGFLAELLEQVGLPEGVISVLPADRETSEYLVSHKDVDKIAFTGSTRAGRRIASIAGEQLKRVSLELGGKSAAIILPDDDAVRIANDSEYGLSGGVWSSDEERALTIARRVRTGTVTVNGASVAFDGPFGGFKASGIGREYGAVGLGTYTEYKTITV
ncbi:aldehyde dehydrogenase family protein [Streptomyces mirabilis]|uniref:aldehyde dehydrogenase family protein n=1 Tax=Streptomyces mirabilis TaxID=68239 RepID=UPI00340CB1DD